MSEAPQFSVPKPIRYEGPRVKGSRFIADIAPVADETQAKQLVAAVAAEFPDASHHCTAWRIARPAIDRANDDGEPSGSAGRPILAQLTGRNLVDVAVVVTRYFGGTKLGVGGLVRAYGGAAAAALDQLEVIPWLAMTELTLLHEYTHTEAIERLAQAASATILDREFDQSVSIRLRLPETRQPEFLAQVGDICAGKYQVSAPDHYPIDPSDPM